MWPFKRTNAGLIREHIKDRDFLLAHPDGVSFEATTTAASKEELDIIKCDIPGIVAGIKERKWTSTDVVKAFIGASKRAQAATNCLTEVNFPAALQRASELDAAFEKTGQLVGELHGVPFSLKDQYFLAGKKSSIGYSEWLKSEPQTTDCALARVVMEKGAICLVKTNVPQSLISFESRNPVFGQTCNPYNPAYISGGSSGGEAALLACDGVAFGFGSDIAGSLRIPTSHCGVYALKPTAGRGFPLKGSVEANPGFEAVRVVSGPMCRSSKDLELLVRIFYESLYPPPDSVVTQAEVQKRFGSESLLYSPLRPAWLQPLEAAKSRSPLRRTLRIGYYYSDGFIRTSPAAVRCVDVAKAALESLNGTDGDKGSKAVELVPIESRRLRGDLVSRIFLGLSSADGFSNLRKPMGPDAMDISLWLIMLPSLSPMLRRIAYFVARFLLRDRRLADVINVAGKKWTTKFLDINAEKKRYAAEFERDVWQAQDLDAIISPTMGVPAMKHYAPAQLSMVASATILYNIIDAPVSIVPVTRVNAELDSTLPSSRGYNKWTKTPGFSTCSPTVSWRLYGRVRDGKGGQYDAKAMHGLPLGIQIAARHGEDELTIGLARLLEDKLREDPQYGFGPGQWSSRTGRS